MNVLLLLLRNELLIAAVFGAISAFGWYFSGFEFARGVFLVAFIVVQPFILYAHGKLAIDLRKAAKDRLASHRATDP